MSPRVRATHRELLTKENLMCCCGPNPNQQAHHGRGRGQACCCHSDASPSLDQLRTYRQQLEDELKSVSDRIAEMENQP